MGIKNSIECYVIRENKEGIVEVLLLHKPKTYRHPAFWQPITGGIELNEKPIDACIREVNEETSLQITFENIEDLKYDFQILKEECDLVIKKSLFICKNLKPESYVKISDEHDDFMWTKLEEVKNYLFWESNKNSFKKLYSLLAE